MSDDAKVLSSEEVNALLQVTQEKNCDLSQLIGTNDHPPEKWSETDYAIDKKALANLTEATYVETEKNSYFFFT